MASEIFKFESVDDGRWQTDDWPLVYYKLTLWAFGSGELKKHNTHRPKHEKQVIGHSTGDKN